MGAGAQERLDLVRLEARAVAGEQRGGAGDDRGGLRGAGAAEAVADARGRERLVEVRARDAEREDGDPGATTSGERVSEPPLEKGAMPSSAKAGVGPESAAPTATT